MPTEAKRATVAELARAFSDSRSAVVSDYRGLKVSELARIRRELREKGISYQVVKNRLAKIAAEQAGRGELAALFTGPTAIALGGADETALARGLLDAVRPFRTVAIRGGLIGTTRIDTDGVTRLAALPGRNVLLAQLAGGIASPLSTMASLLSAPLRNLAYALQQVRDQRESASPREAPVPDETAEAPVPEATAEAPVPEATAEAPVPEATAEAPVPEATAEAPVPEATAEAS
jgi:large subunit ribosomal protein L10